MKSRMSRPGDERRLSLRVPVCLPVMAEGEAFFQGLVTKDLSASGVYLIGDLDLGPAAGLTLELHLPGDLGVVRSSAVVVRLQQEAPRGLGLAWTRLKEADRKRLEELDRRWRQAFPGSAAGA